MREIFDIFAPANPFAEEENRIRNLTINFKKPMNMKKVYQRPQSEVVPLKIKSRLLDTSGSAEKMNTVDGSWDAES